jgi:hypothetical protein
MKYAKLVLVGGGRPIQLVQMLTVGLCILNSKSASAAPNAFEVLDRHGRVLNSNQITLVDWDGQIANPAIRLNIRPPDNAGPFFASLTANGVRLYFDSPSTNWPDGRASKTIEFDGTGNPVPVYISAWPDRDGADDSHILTVSGAGVASSIPIKVVDQDLNTSDHFAISCDFLQDRTNLFTDPNATTFFSQSNRQAVFCQAANDWAYFIDRMGLDRVEVGQESSGAWESPHQHGFENFVRFPNTVAFTGFLLYANSTTLVPQSPDDDPGRGGGGPIGDQPGQSAGGATLAPKLCRSGGVSVDTLNPPESTWRVSLDDDKWWEEEGGKDLYSVVMHETGHALAFHGHYPQFQTFLDQHKISDPAVVAYLGHEPSVHPSAHLHDLSGNPEIDPASQKAGFGSPGGIFPVLRWPITKLDLLVLQAVGYKLRRTSAFIQLSIRDLPLAWGRVGQQYSDILGSDGGIPAYYWTVVSGRLPPGLTLNSFTGEISGSPLKSGPFDFRVGLQDANNGLVDNVFRDFHILVVGTVPIGALADWVTGVLLLGTALMVLHRSARPNVMPGGTASLEPRR